MSDNSYLKLYRKILESEVFQNEGLLKVWLWCMCRASFTKRYVSIKNGKGTIEVLINPGQFIFGRNSAANELNMKPSTVRNRIDKLKKLKNLDIKKDNQYSIISIRNWDIYQNVKQLEGQANEQQLEQQPEPKLELQQIEKPKVSTGLTGKNLECFNKLFKTFGYGNKSSAAEAFFEKQDIIMNDFEKVLKAAELECKSRPTNKEGRKYKKQLTSWILKECWDDTFYQKIKVPGKAKFGLTNTSGNKLSFKDKKLSSQSKETIIALKKYDQLTNLEKEAFYKFGLSKCNSGFFRMNEYIKTIYIDSFLLQKKNELVQ